MKSNFQSAKKCSVCGQWSDWNMQASDTCEHCGAILDDAFLRTLQNETEPKKKNQIEIDFIQIYPTDSFLVKIGKRIILALQISFVAIVSFIIWFLTLLAG